MEEERPPEILQARFEDLLVDENAREEYVLSTGKKVVLRKLTTKDIRDITRLSKDDAITYAMYMVARGVVEPSMSPAQVEKLKPPLMFEIANAVARFSNMDAGSLRKAGFLPPQTPEEEESGL